MVDGTHARETGQCRNGGELLDHFVDPLSFSYWMIGIAVSCSRLDMAVAAVLCIYATAVLVSIKAKLIGQFALARLGPTEFKAMLVIYGLAMATVSSQVFGGDEGLAGRVALWALSSLIVLGVVQLIVNLIKSIRQVNADGKPPDTTAWQLGASDENSSAQDCPSDTAGATDTDSAE
jgi:phosphatidylglycerophosphate synthase